jgi:hypothetical protein
MAQNTYIYNFFFSNLTRHKTQQTALLLHLKYLAVDKGQTYNQQTRLSHTECISPLSASSNAAHWHTSKSLCNKTAKTTMVISLNLVNRTNPVHCFS